MIKSLYIFLGVLLTSSLAFSEGTIDLEDTAGGGARGNLIGSGRVFAFLAEGETLNMASSALGLASGAITYTRPDGSSRSCSTSGSVGLIASRSQEVQGSGVGYTPCSVTATAGESGIWSVEFISPGSDKRTEVAIAVNENWVQGNFLDILAWDVSVSSGGALGSGGQAISGRAYMTIFGGDVGAFTQGEVFYNFFVLTKDGYQYEVDTNGFQPYGFSLFANNKGHRLLDGQPSYFSVLSSEASIHDVNTPDSDTDITFKMFFNLPDSSMPQTSVVGGQNTWLFRAPATTATFNDFSFVGDEGTPNKIAFGKGGTFNFETDTLGSTFVIRMDLDSDGTPEVQVVLSNSVVGVNTAKWDGRDTNGNFVAPGEYNPTVSIEAHLGEIHFPFVDVEFANNGLIITRLNGGGAFPNTGVFWNDSRLLSPSGPDFSNSPQDSSTGARSWTVFEYGDARHLDTWAYYGYTPIPPISTTLDIGEASLFIDSLVKVSPTNPDEGDQITFTYVVRNAGPSDVDGAPVKFVFNPNLMSGFSMDSCTSSGVASCGLATESGGEFSFPADIDAGSSLTITITGTVASNLPDIANFQPVAGVLRPADVTNPNATEPTSVVPTSLEVECNGTTPNSYPLSCPSVATLSFNISDSDGDGVLDRDDLDSDNDGIPNTVEGTLDTDMDGVPDYLDIDSDNDGLTDTFEAGGADSNGDGRLDNFTDTNNDGQDDASFAEPLPLPDTDGDLKPDYLDLDSDNDSITDATEAGYQDQDGDGEIDEFTDTDSDGYHDGAASDPITPLDSDSDGVPNYIDLDSDNDGEFDIFEVEGPDVDNDGLVDNFTDANQNGLDDSLEARPSIILDFDEDGILDYVDPFVFIDTDGDGISDDEEIAQGLDPFTSDVRVQGSGAVFGCERAVASQGSLSPTDIWTKLVSLLFYILFIKLTFMFLRLFTKDEKLVN